MRVVQLLAPLAFALTVRAVAVPVALDARQANTPGCTVQVCGQCGGQGECVSGRLLDAGSRFVLSAAGWSGCTTCVAGATCGITNACECAASVAGRG
jgi:hypothetical protein